jgi:hypothetical protein
MPRDDLRPPHVIPGHGKAMNLEPTTGLIFRKASFMRVFAIMGSGFRFAAPE